jgi:predicted transcriptional regulator
MSMDPESTEYLEFDERISKIVEEMRALNISSITIVQDSVTIGMGDAE